MKKAFRWSGAIGIAAAVAFDIYGWHAIANRTPLKSTERSLIGSKAVSIVARAVTGEFTRLDVGTAAGPTIVYVFSPTCEWCERNANNINALVRNARGQYRIIGLSLGLEPPFEYSRQHAFEFPVYDQPSSETKAAYHLGGTPQTVVVRDGVIVANWIGAYGESRRSEVENFFRMRLPGLTQEATIPSRRNVVCVGPEGGLYSPGSKVTWNDKSVKCDSGGQWVEIP
jgi:hypothetical protein